MCLARLSKLKIVLAVLLPYMVLAIGSEFLHNHGGEHSALHAARAPARNSQAHVRVALCSTHAVTSHDEGACPACLWAKSNVSSPQVVSPVEHTTCICEPIFVQCFPNRTGGIRLASSRGPPLS